MLGHVPSTNSDVAFIRDPWGNSYGYSTVQVATGSPDKGYNPTFDLWSTGPPATTGAANTDPNKFVKNW
jgi:hypothetical protein